MVTTEDYFLLCSRFLITMNKTLPVSFVNVMASPSPSNNNVNQVSWNMELLKSSWRMSVFNGMLTVLLTTQ